MKTRKLRKARETANRIMNHAALGMLLGVLLAVVLLFANPGRFHALVVGAHGPVGGPLGLIVGCAVLIGVGAAITGFIFDEVERS
jgi:hypothetical protein